MAKMKNKVDLKANKKNKQSSKKLLSVSSNAMKSKKENSNANPFETIWSRRKFDILGKKRKGEERRIALARSVAIDKRKKTLLKEYEQSNKSSMFLDKRIGEKNDSLGEFDKAILRFQRERQSMLNKKSKYNLSDGEEEDFDSLTRRDDFEDEMSPDDMDENETKRISLISDEVNNPLESSSLDGDENKHKTKKQVMEEIILKSKFYKAQKAKEKEEDQHLLDQLDKSFTSLSQTDALLSSIQRSKMNALGKEKPDTYDKLVKEMVLDMRARPSDRIKTPEEIAQEERERLEQLEEERQKRMFAFDDSDDAVSDGDEDFNKSNQRRLRSVSGDDLGDSFSVDDEKPKKKGWVDEILSRKDVGDIESENGDSSDDAETDDNDDQMEGSDEEDSSQKEVSDGDGDPEVSGEIDGESANILSLKDWEQSDDSNLETDLEEGEQDELKVERIQLNVNNNDVRKTRKQKTDSLNMDRRNVSAKPHSVEHESVPFVIEAPNSLKELSSLLDNLSDDKVPEAIRRIRVCNAISLAAENRRKMQVFYGVLLQYFAILANQKPLNFKRLNLLVKPLMEMSVETPYFAAICARQRILRMRTQFCEDIKNPERSSWPLLKTLFLFRLWSMIFPCSDFRHVVMTPMILLMCEYLMHSPIVSGRDIAIGTFLCSVVLNVTKQSRKFCPEAIIFLQTMLMSAIETDSKLDQHSQYLYFMEIKALKPWLQIHSCVHDIDPIDFLMVMDLPANSPYFSSDNFRVKMLVSVVETLQGFVNIYGEFNSFPEIFLPISAILRKLVKQEKKPDLLHDKMIGVAEVIEKKANEYLMLRQPVQMQKQKPVAIKLLNPKFEENFVKGRDYDPDRERAERKKLKKLLKRESKGAARELRKDNYFLFEVKERNRSLLEEERAEKYGKALAFLQEQESAFKSGQLGKGRNRRK